MQFCPECNFMVYTKLSTPEGDGDEPSLINYCKNCSWTGTLKNTEDAIYKRNYENDFIADRILNNKYTIYDNALPRLRIGCVNENCLTNLEIDNERSLIINNLPETITEEEIFTDLLSEDINREGREILKRENVKRLRLTSIAITTSNKADRDYLIDKYNEIEYETNILTTSEYKKPDNEVLYIKYDPENMKYLYMCVNCGSSWQGNY
tara:strand:+ start:119 stop:742 length:624 start_codon:yes stop_codon:yes gene_type:complete